MKRIRERGKEGFDDTEDEEEPVEEEEATREDDQAGEGRVNFAWIQDLESNDVFLVELLFEWFLWSRLGVAGIILSSLMRIILSGPNRKMPTLLSLRRASSQTILYVILYYTFIIVMCQRWCDVDDCVVLDVEGAGLFQPKDAHTAVTQTGIQPDGTVGQILETVFIINSDPTKQGCWAEEKEIFSFLLHSGNPWWPSILRNVGHGHPECREIMIFSTIIFIQPTSQTDSTIRAKKSFFYFPVIFVSTSLP